MYVIGTECIACGRCFRNCPLGCIEPGDEKYEIDQNQCVQCGTCFELCPLSAIEKTDSNHTKG